MRADPFLLIPPPAVLGRFLLRSSPASAPLPHFPAGLDRVLVQMGAFLSLQAQGSRNRRSGRQRHVDGQSVPRNPGRGPPHVPRRWPSRPLPRRQAFPRKRPETRRAALPPRRARSTSVRPEGHSGRGRRPRRYSQTGRSSRRRCRILPLRQGGPIELAGRLDLAAGDPPVIIDLKWGGESYHRDKLKNGTAFQLATYAFIYGKAAEFPPVAYFVIRNQNMITPKTPPLTTSRRSPARPSARPGTRSWRRPRTSQND